MRRHESNREKRWCRSSRRQHADRTTGDAAVLPLVCTAILDRALFRTLDGASFWCLDSTPPYLLTPEGSRPITPKAGEDGRRRRCTQSSR